MAVSNLGPSCVLVPSCMVLPPNCMFVGQLEAFNCQDAFVATVTKTKESSRLRLNRVKRAWHTAETMKTKLGWSKSGSQRIRNASTFHLD